MNRPKRVSLLLLAGFYVVAGVLHFMKPEDYLRIVPPALPAPLAFVLLSGAAEIALGIAVLFRRTRRLAAFGIIGLLVAIFPANLYMYRHSLETGGEVFGVDSTVLYWRLWLQLGFIAWAYWHSRRDDLRAYPV